MSNNLNDPRNITGMADILADDDEDLDIAEIEKSIIGDDNFNKSTEEDIDYAEEYNQELQNLSRQFNDKTTSDFETSLNDVIDTKETTQPKSYDPPPKMDDDLDGWSIEKESNALADEINSQMGDGDTNYQTSRESRESRDMYRGNNHQTSRRADGDDRWNPSHPADEQMYSITEEERKQSHINKVLSNLDQDKDDNNFIDNEDEEDEMARVVEQIDLLRSNLEAEGVNLDRIPEVDVNTPKKKAKGVLKILIIKNDRLRYCDMFEEGILAVAYGLESAFDGKREWFGSKIDLVGWPETVKVKLRRMRYDTSSFVSSVMSNYSTGHGWRIILELLPSLFLYSRDRRMRVNDNLISDTAYRNAINEM